MTSGNEYLQRGWLEAASLSAWTLAVSLMMPAAVFAGAGFQTLEQGTTDVGRALVGAVSAADSAATAFYNPAGMMLLDAPQVSGGVMQIVGDVRFKQDAGTTFTGGNGGQVASDAIMPTGPFYVHPLSERWAVGVSLTAPFAGAMEYNKAWVGRNIVTEIDFLTLNLRPAVAYRINDKLSLGASVAISYAIFDEKIAIETPGPRDGTVHIHNADDWEVGFSLSAMLEPRAGTRIGFIYTSELEHDLSGDLNIDVPLLPGFSFGLDTVLVLPQAAAVSVRQEIDERLTVYFDIGWVDFSSFDVTKIDLSGGASVELLRNWGDAMLSGVGVEYHVAPGWTLHSGISYASSPTKNKDRTPDLPLDRQVRYAVGVVHQYSETFKIGFSYEYLDMGNAKIAKTIAGGTLSGKYSDNDVQFFALSFMKSF